MSWTDYYFLLEKYGGDLTKATKGEMDWAARGNPNNPSDALALAKEKYFAPLPSPPEGERGMIPYSSKDAVRILDNLRRHKWVSFVNYKKEFPNINAGRLFRRPTVKSYWSGKLWHFTFLGYAIVFDFRLHPFRDMIFPEQEQPK